MSAEKLPKTDSIEELAKFWDSHDLTDFEDQLEEVTEQEFEDEDTFRVQLDHNKAVVVRQLAASQGFPPSQLIQHWVDEKIGDHPAGQTNCL